MTVAYLGIWSVPSHNFNDTVQVAVAMFGYMTDLETVEVQKTEEVTAEGEP